MISNGAMIVVTVAAYFLFSSAVGAMLPPEPGQERSFYGWLYRFLQRLAANADRLAEAKFGLGAAEFSGTTASATRETLTVTSK